VQTVTGAHNASIEAANQGNAEQAATWAGIRDTFGQLGALSWRLSGFDELAQDKLLIAAATGSAKGLKDFAHGTQQLILHPQETMRQLEQVLNRLDHLPGNCIAMILKPRQR